MRAVVSTVCFQFAINKVVEEEVVVAKKHKNVVTSRMFRTAVRDLISVPHHQCSALKCTNRSMQLWTVSQYRGSTDTSGLCSESNTFVFSQEPQTILKLNHAFIKIMGVLTQRSGTFFCRYHTVDGFMFFSLRHSSSSPLLFDIVAVCLWREKVGPFKTNRAPCTHAKYIVACLLKKAKKQNLFIFLSRSQNSHFDSCS